MAAPNNVWKIMPTAMETKNFAEIMSEEYAKQLQGEELKRFEKKVTEQQQPVTALNGLKSYAEAATTSKAAEIINEAPKNGSTEVWEDYTHLLYDEATAAEHATRPLTEQELSDAAIARILQTEEDLENDEALQRREKQQNKQSKITVSLDKFRRLGYKEFEDAQNFDAEEEEDETQSLKRDWDRFETNEKKFDTIPKCGFKIDKEGEMITKHDPELCGVRNACRVMSFPPEFPTGDGAGFDMKLSNKVFNQLKTYSRRNNTKKNRMQDRKEHAATAEMGLDGHTVMLLYKLVTNQILEQVNGIISTGKEAVILHAESDPSYTGEELEKSTQKTAAGRSNNLALPPPILPKECAIKIFKTTLNEFKQRDRYIKDDYRFKDRFSKQNNRTIINMWAEKEMHNMMRMQSVGINCPDIVMLKKHVLVMSFIGENHNAAPKLKDARLSTEELSCAYEEIIEAMHKLYNDAKLVHADLSEYNILWYHGKCWFIDVAQAVEPEHPSALEFLMRDCSNIVNFFTKRGLPNIYTKEQLFEHVTSMNAETHNAAMLERIHTRGATIEEATAPNQAECPDELRPLVYPFDLAWEKSLLEREQQNANQTATTSATTLDANITNTANH